MTPSRVEVQPKCDHARSGIHSVQARSLCMLVALFGSSSVNSHTPSPSNTLAQPRSASNQKSGASCVPTRVDQRSGASCVPTCINQRPLAHTMGFLKSGILFCPSRTIVHWILNFIAVQCCRCLAFGSHFVMSSQLCVFAALLHGCLTLAAIHL